MPHWLADLSILLRLAVALVIGAAIGWEREAARKAAGLRTHMLVAMAAALFVTLGDSVVERFSDSATGAAAGGATSASAADIGIRSDPIRVIEAIVTGISFLGAGTIFVSRGREKVRGLTTAAAILATSAIGIAVGLERYVLAVGATALTLFILRVVPLLVPDPEPDGTPHAG